MIVSDTNLVAYLVIAGAHTSVARAVYCKDAHWVLPPLWRSEFLSVLAVAVRAKALTEAQGRAAWRSATDTFGASEREPNALLALSLAIQTGISAYDAQFVALAQALGTVLVTADRQLVRRCPESAVLMTDYLRAGPR
jgi:predicted nucleic acid-binding protein